MIEQLKELPGEIIGIKATGEVTREDYEKVVLPLFEKAHSETKRLSLLYEVGADFKSFTPGAAWEDFRVAVKYLSLFKRVAVVTDVAWIRKFSQTMAAFLPYEVHCFNLDQSMRAMDWLQEIPKSTIKFDYVADRQTLLIEPQGALSTDDFNKLATEITAHLGPDQELKGLVVHVSKFPGWENFGSFFRHVQFIRENHKKLSRIAVSSDSPLADWLPRIASQFVHAEVKGFAYHDLENAMNWVANSEVRKSVSSPRRPPSGTHTRPH